MWTKIWTYTKSCAKYVATAAITALLTYLGVGCVIARSAST